MTDFGGKIGKFTKLGKIHGSRKKKRGQSRITGKIKDSNSRFTKKIELNSRITEKIKGGQFTVHEENKTQFTVHSKKKPNHCSRKYLFTPLLYIYANVRKGGVGGLACSFFLFYVAFKAFFFSLVLFINFCCYMYHVCYLHVCLWVSVATI